MALQNISINFTDRRDDWELQPFNRKDNPFKSTRDNPTGPDGLNYKEKFCFEYEDLRFRGLTPSEFLDKYINAQHGCSGFYAGVVMAYPKREVSTRQTFDLVPIMPNIGTVTNMGSGLPDSSKSRNISKQSFTHPLYLYDVEYLLKDTSFDPLNKSYHFVMTKYETTDGKDLPLEDTFKPVVIYQKPGSNSFTYRLHSDHMEDYASNLVHCNLDSTVEFLNADGSYCGGVFCDGKEVNGPVSITKMINSFAVTSGYKKTTNINVGYNPACHVQVAQYIHVFYSAFIQSYFQCKSGQAVSGDPEIAVIPWELKWLTNHSNSVIISGNYQLCNEVVYIYYASFPHQNVARLRLLHGAMRPFRT
jgi:hypothetical protein